MIYNIGIDISKYKHDFCIISNTGEIIVENSSFENNKKGFQSLLDQLKPYNKPDVHIAFEATGHYSKNLELFFNWSRLFIYENESSCHSSVFKSSKLT